MKRQTLQKSIISNALKQLGNHPTPAMVYEKIHPEYPSISPATVFRVLAGECEEGRAQRVYVPGGTVRYEYGTRRHSHIRCRICGKIADVETPPSLNPVDSVLDAEGFSVESCFLEFIGLCPDCRKASDATDKNKF